MPPYCGGFAAIAAFFCGPGSGSQVNGPRSTAEFAPWHRTLDDAEPRLGPVPRSATIWHIADCGVAWRRRLL